MPITIPSLPIRALVRAGCALLACAAVLWTAGCGPSNGNPKVPAGAKSSGGSHAAIDTDKGTIEIELLSSDAPK
ncbi:MAG: hypothetical protein ABI211_18855, partial [Vicinamibacterales bacterium]